MKALDVELGEFTDLRDNLLRNQIEACLKLVHVACAAKVRCALLHEPGDAPCVMRLEYISPGGGLSRHPDAFEICSNGTGGYDAWVRESRDRGHLRIWKNGLDLIDAVALLTQHALARSV